MKRLTALFLLLPVIAGCVDTVGPDSVTGTYELESINGSDLPFAFPGIQIVGGSITLRSNGSYTGRTIVRVFDHDRPVIDERAEVGDYERYGSTISLRSSVGVRTDATVTGRRLTIEDGEIVSVYRR